MESDYILHHSYRYNLIKGKSKAPMRKTRIVPLLAAAAIVCLQTFAATYTDIEYAHPDGKPLLLDASVPDGGGPFPAVIIVHGGSWVNGNKSVYVRPLFPLLSQAGYAWFSIDYRLGPDYKYPLNVQDVEAAIKWVKANGPKYHVDTERIALAGESAGGHLVALVGAQNKPESHVAAVVDFYGVNDLTVVAKMAKAPPKEFTDLLGVTDFSPDSMKLIREASPLTYVHADMPPFLFIHGSADTVVPFMMSPLMCEAMQKVNAECQVVKVEGANHGMEGWEGKPGMDNWKPILIDWLNTTLKVKPVTSRNSIE